ncbi:hypothetical protein ACLOJK_040404 [Asimina triloba]
MEETLQLPHTSHLPIASPPPIPSAGYVCFMRNRVLDAISSCLLLTLAPQRILPPSLSLLRPPSVAALIDVAASTSHPSSFTDCHPSSLFPLCRSLVLPPSSLSVAASSSLPLPSPVAVVILLGAFNVDRHPLPLPPPIITLPPSPLSIVASSSLPLPSPAIVVALLSAFNADCTPLPQLHCLPSPISCSSAASFAASRDLLSDLP